MKRRPCQSAHEPVRCIRASLGRHLGFVGRLVGTAAGTVLVLDGDPTRKAHHAVPTKKPQSQLAARMLSGAEPASRDPRGAGTIQARNPERRSGRTGRAAFRGRASGRNKSGHQHRASSDLVRAGGWARSRHPRHSVVAAAVRTGGGSVRALAPITGGRPMPAIQEAT